MDEWEEKGSRIKNKEDAEGDEMTTFKENVKGIKGPLLEFLKTHAKAEHHREFE